MLKPLKDVDIVCLLPAYRWELLHGPDGPAKAMESFEAPIEDRWPDVQFDVGDDYVLMGERNGTAVSSSWG